VVCVFFFFFFTPPARFIGLGMVDPASTSSTTATEFLDEAGIRRPPLVEKWRLAG